MAMSVPVATVAERPARRHSGGVGTGPDHQGRGRSIWSPRSRPADWGRPGGSVGTHLAATIPEAASIVLVLFDGLGDLQLAHPGAGVFRGARRGVLEAPFPTTTTVSMATIASGTSPATHGVIAHLSWLPELGRVVNTLKWVDLSGAAVDYPTHRLLPSPNLWERLGRREGSVP